MRKRYDLHTAVATAETYKGLGRPVPENVRLRWFKKLEAKATKPFVFRQIRFNEGVTDALHHLRMAAEGNVMAPESREQYVQQQEGVSSLRRDMVVLQQELVDMQQRLEEAQTKQHLAIGQVDLFLNSVRRKLPDGLTTEALVREPTAWDHLYNAFEDLQRGSYAEIQSRLGVYLADVPTSDDPVIDIGCGRGEWLDLLKQKGVPAYGVDNNPDVAERAVGRGLDVRTADAIEHLAELKDRTVAAVTAFHVAEHLPLEALIALIDGALRVLRPGGKLILETPNPSNLTVGATTFWLDPTHIRPLPSDLLAFLVSSRGFVDVEVRPLHRSEPPVPQTDLGENPDPTVGRLVELVNHHLGAAADYAVVGTRL